MLLEQINIDLKLALKAGDAARVILLRGLVSELHNREIAKRGELTEEETLEVLRRELKKRKEAAELYLKGGRRDLADKESVEADMVSAYLPAMMSEFEIEKIVDKFARENCEFNAVMRQVMQELKGKADGGMVSEVVKRRFK